jgi:hypothetical protein
MIKFLAKTLGVIALLILFMVFLKNPLETSVGIVVMGGWIGLMFTPCIRREMKKGLSFKESVKQVFKESLVNGSGDGSFQHNHSAFDCDENYNSSMNSSSICDTEEPWWSDPSRRSEPGNIYHNS